MSDLNLYEITQAAIQLEESLSEGEITEENKESLVEQLKDMLQNNAEDIIEIKTKYQDKIDAIKKRKKNLNKIQREYKNKISNLEKYLTQAMAALGEKKVETTAGKIALRNTPGSVEIADEMQLPKAVLKQSVKIDKRVLKQMIKDGEIDESIAFIKKGQSLSIK